jgi:hypothetical protein
MSTSTFIDKPYLPLEICGYEANTAQDVFILTRALDANLAQSLEANGYMQRTGIVLSNGQVIDGWIKV